MNVQSIILLAVIIVWFVAAIIKIARKGTCGCGGSKCSGNCESCGHCSCGKGHKK